MRRILGESHALQYTIAMAVVVGALAAGCGGEGDPASHPDNVIQELNWESGLPVEFSEGCQNEVVVPGAPGVGDEVDKWRDLVILSVSKPQADEYDAIGVAYAWPEQPYGEAGLLPGDLAPRTLPGEPNRYAARLRRGPDEVCFSFVGLQGDHIELLPTEKEGRATIVDEAFWAIPLY